jgi:2'-5' RNA ligase
MEYLVVHFVSDPAKENIWKVIRQAMSFDVQQLSLDPHITLKYDTPEKFLPLLENNCEKLSKRKAPSYILEGLGSYGEKTIYLDVKPSPQLHDLQTELGKGLPKHTYELQGMHLHVTLANRIAKEYAQVKELLEQRPLFFQQQLNNLAILAYDGKNFKIHKTYRLKE